LDTPPETLKFETGPFGKPFLPNSRLRFSVSHSGPALLLAFAWDQEVGVDVERLRSDFVPEDLARQVFSAQEQAALGEKALVERHAAFLSHWTAKEAYVKALGRGLSFPLPLLTLSPTAGTDRYGVKCEHLGGIFGTITICRLPALPGCAASLAAEGIVETVMLLPA
jgi:4'-phosphopantetheinyl transferase